MMSCRNTVFDWKVNILHIYSYERCTSLSYLAKNIQIISSIITAVSLLFLVYVFDNKKIQPGGL
jgi:hypothetical protein